MAKSLTIADLQQEMAQLKAEMLSMREQLSWMSRIFSAYGIRGPWLTPPKAAPLLGLSHDRIIDEIDRAETLRMLGKQGDLVYGTHYRDDRSTESSSASWKVHVANFDEFLKTPPDQRRAG
ncbi:hypothetical protein IQ268_09265 [Oculatella sp. LEGE 06141]|uniref:hypothetical protein n=1 Tax=Oculatella sp. LEGE 06141 TaxID=1828648 RepID=UPI00187E5004|nr:hypothetical protein [Oculatella sp. LEGE 06141]MBE9178748.1 hypothetical protein [Oculatella sp. LEGE 06141]